MQKKSLFKSMTAVLLIAVVFASCEKDDDPQGTIYVPDDFSTIQAAIDASANGDEIIVKPGLYPENINFNSKEVTVRSTAPENQDTVMATIIDGSEQASVVTIENGESNQAILNGFTITNGFARDGAGIYIDNYSAPLIKNNLITENICGRGGGGGAFVTNGSAPVFEQNIFDNNINSRTTSRSGLALYVRNESEAVIQNNIFRNHEGVRGVIAIGSSSDDLSHAEITGNTLENNTTDYGTGGIAVNGSEVTVNNNLITNNTGGGSGIDAGGAFSIRNEASVVISENTITNNWATNAGAVAIGNDAQVIIDNNVITGNSSGEEGTTTGTGGGIFIESSVAEIYNNTITNNTSWNTNVGGGGIYVADSDVTIDNNHISNNRASRSGGGILLRGHGQTSTLVATVTNNVIENNEALGHAQTRGGAIYVGWIQQATIYGNTINDNSSGFRAGGIFVDEETPVYGENNTQWERMNYPPQEEIYNQYSGNEHVDDEFAGRHVFFSDFSK